MYKVATVYKNMYILLQASFERVGPAKDLQKSIIRTYYWKLYFKNLKILKLK